MLTSPELPADTYHCLSFFYLMRDNAGVGRLNVFASSLQDDEPLEVMLWSRQGDQGDRTKGDAANWLSAQINVQHDYKHAINIQAVRGHGYLVIIDLYFCYHSYYTHVLLFDLHASSAYLRAR